MKAKKKRGVEVPPKIRDFVTSVTAAPFENIELPLTGFKWEYDKGDFYHWVDLMNHFDSYFERIIRPRKDLQLEGEPYNESLPFPKEAVLQILRVTQVILENCVNKYCYSSYEHLSSLFTSTDSDVVTASLQTLAAFVKKPVQSNRAVRWHGDQALNARLFSLVQGWGGKEVGLGLVACVLDDGCDHSALRMGSTLHFEFYLDESTDLDCVENNDNIVGLQIIHMDDLHSYCGSDLSLLKELVDHYRVPSSLRFSLLTRLRFAMSFHSVHSRRQLICIRLLAFTILMQSNPDHEDLSAFFANEPEFTTELVALLHYEDSVPEDIRIFAVLALAAQAQDRSRQSIVINAISAGGHPGILSNLMQKSISFLNGAASSCSISLMEALLYLVTVLVSSSSGCAALKECGLIPTLLPLLKDTNPLHTQLVSAAVHVMEVFMDYSNPAGTLFRDLGGLDDAVGRLKLEISRVEENASRRREEQPASEETNLATVDLNAQQTTTSPSETLITFQQRTLLKDLLRVIALGTYAPGNAARIDVSEESVLASCLCTIFRHAKEFGGGVFSLAASVMSDLIHKDPTCYSGLESTGLPAAFLNAITSGVLPSSEAISCIPQTLDALCLNNSGLQAVKDCNALGCLVKVFTSKSYLRALANETPGSLATGLEELMRHAPSLRGSGVDACIDILSTIAAVGGVSTSSNQVEDIEAPVPMETDGAVPMEQQSGAASCQSLVDISEACLLEYMNNAARLLESLLQNAETCRVFIEKKGVEAILTLYTLPNLPVSFGGSSVAHSMFSVFRAFSPQHASVLARAVCGALRESLTATVEAMLSLTGDKLFELESSERKRVVRCLTSTELFLSLSSVLVRSTNTMMNEISAGGPTFLSSIGKVYREVLWQISLIDEARAGSKREDSGGNAEAASAGSGAVNCEGTAAREGEDDLEVSPAVQYVNPVSIRDGTSSHWRSESEYFPVMPSGDGLHRRARRDQSAVANFFSARAPRLARYTHVPQVDLEGASNSGEGSQSQDNGKGVCPDTLDYDMMTRLVLSVRGLFVALGKAMVIPSRRRDDVASPGSTAKGIASEIAKLFHDTLGFDSQYDSIELESVKCRFFGKVVDDMLAVLFDSRRNTCNTLLVNSFYAHGALGRLFDTFKATCQILWELQSSDFAMETGTDSHKNEPGLDKRSCLLETLRSYAKLLEHLVTSALLLSPQPTAQLLVQPVAGAAINIPKDPEALARKLQLQVLENILPVWKHPLFTKCGSSLVASVASILTQIYSGVVDVKDRRNGDARLFGPPPDESSISTIVEMGFSRERAEEALRRVVTNSVEMAMEWLFSHPEEPQEDDELARALALSLGSSDAATDTKSSKGKETLSEEENIKVPPVEEMLATCTIVLQNNDAAIFPLTDLLVTMCNHNKGEDRAGVVAYLVHQLKLSAPDAFSTNSNMLSMISHSLVLILNEDSTTREVAAEHGLVTIALDILSRFEIKKGTDTLVTVPKWATALLLVLDLLLQYKPKMSKETEEPAATSNIGAASGSGSGPDHQRSEVRGLVNEMESDPFIATLGKAAGFLTENEQHHAMTIACNFLGNQIPATTVQAVLQLCARLTKTHSVAIQFLEAGGLTAILNLPRQSLFPGFDSVAAVIIRHLLEDVQTLQQAMELEIRHTLMATLQRHNGRVSTRMFLTALAPVVLRNPGVFMQASAAVCQIENIGGRPHIVLAKEKEKSKDDKDKGKVGTSGVHNGASCSDGTKAPDVVSKSKGHHKKVPHSFAQVVDQLLEVILYSTVHGRDCKSSDSAAPMDVENRSLDTKGKAKCDEVLMLGQGQLSDTSAGLAKVAFILKLMTEILLMYSGAVGVVLRRDSESSQSKVPNQAGSEVVGHGGLLYHILHRLLPYAAEKVNEKSNEDEWKEKLSVKAAYFLLAVCIRSGEGRRRVVSEISRALSSFASNTLKNSVKKVHPPSRKVKAFVFLVNLILSANTSSTAQAPGFSIEMAKVMIDSGLVQSLTSTLQVIDLDHPEVPKSINAVLKALEVLTRASHSVDLLYATATRADTNAAVTEERSSDQGVHLTEGQPSDESQQNGHLVISTSNPGNDPGLSEAQLNAESMPADVNNSRDQNLESNVQTGQLDSDNADGYLDEASERVPGQGGTVTAERQFGVGQRIENVVEDDEEMDADDGEEEDEEDEDEDDMEGAEAVPHLSPPETDVEDHEDNGLGDDYGEDMVEDEDEDDDWQENQVVEVRWRDGFTRFNQVQVLGHGGPAALVDFPGDPFQGMNEIFSSFRRSTVVDRRRPAAAYRPFPERSAGDRGGVFHHPLLERPALPSGVVSTTGAGNNALWGAAGSISRDADALLTGFDVSHFYMYDPVMPEHMGDRFFAEPPPPLLDFSVDPGYLTGRRGTRSDGRLSTWTDDGQPQAGAYAAALAQGIEQQFICRLRSLLPGEEPAADQTDNNVEAVAQPAGDVPIVEQEEPATRGEGASSQDAGVPSSADIGMQSEAEVSARRTDVGQGNAEGGQSNASEGGQGNTAEEGQDNTLDGRVMRGEEVSREVTALGGESLQSSEINISNDCNRTISNAESVEMNVEGILSGHMVTTDSGEQSLDEAVNCAAIENDTELVEHQEAPQEEDGNHTQAEYRNRQEGLQEVNTIDPTFLEALPEYLRAEVLASHETQTARAANVPQPSLPTEDIDPEFLAALPPDIQAEVLAQQRAQRLIQAQQVEGQPVEMDSASIIATFPAELREEVLLTSSDQVLEALPPSLLAEAQLLRERAMNQYQTRGLFGSANRIGVRRNNIGMPPGSHSATERGIVNLPMGRRSANASMKIKEVEGEPLIDIGGLKSILRLLCLAQPLIAKGLLQRLLLNLCGHSVTRANLVKLLLDMLRPRGENSVESPELSQRLYGCRWNVVYARSQLSDGVPPLVSRRVLEILTHLGKHHDEGADLLTYMEPTGICSSTSQTICEEKGKAKLIDEVTLPETTGKTLRGDIPLVLLLKLLNQPLYSRSSAHLEQLMGLLDVVTNKLSTKYQQFQLVDSVKAGEDQEMEGDPTTSGTHGTRQDEDSTRSGMPGASRQEGGPTTSGIPETSRGQGDAEQSQLGMERASLDSQQSRLSMLGAESNDPHGQEPSTSGGGKKLVDLYAIILSLPKPELRRLCRLLAQEGLSDTAYNRVSEVLKKLANAAPAHRWLFISELEHAARGLSSSAVNELQNLGNTDGMICRTSSMAGAAVLRVLQCLSNLTGECKQMEKDASSEQKEGLRTLQELNMHLEPLWQELSACIAKLEARLGNTGPLSAVVMVSTAGGAMGSGSLPPETQRVLPFVEAFFALCDSLRFSSAVSIHSEPGTATAREIKEAASSSVPSSTASVSKGPSGIHRRPEGGVTFLRFAEKHRKMLNSFVRQNAALLEKSLSLLLQTPRLIDFDNKRAYFRSRIRQQHEQQHYTPLRICVRRAYVLEDSYNQLRMRTPEELKGRLTVQFQGEEGIDAGGLTREWYQLLSRVIFDKGALLFTTVGNESSFQPNPNSVYQTEHLSYFKFVGRVVAKALFDGQLLDVYFTRSFYKHILGVKVTYHDIEAVDPSYYKNLMWMLENDISDDVELFFSVDADEEKHILYEKTEVTDIELIPGGRNVRVTEENKHEYVDLIAEHKLTTAIRPQINAFLEGFSELINRDLITVFNDKELELLISGLPEIDVDDLKVNTEYTGYTATSLVVQWFWEVVRAFNKEDMARLMQFITGTSKVPLEGFKALQGISGPQRCQIHKAYGAPDRLPTAHTCFNQLDLPEYLSKEQLQERLLLAIHEGSEGFAFG